MRTAFISPHGVRSAFFLVDFTPIGQGLTGTTSVTFNGVPATSFDIVSDTFMTAVLPSGATTGPVVVTTPNGTLTNNKSFQIR